MIVLFPGFWSLPADYHSFLRSIVSPGERFEVVDLFSRESKWPAPCEWQEWNKKIEEKLATLRPRLLIGYSLGGRLLLNLQSSLPSLFLSTHPGLGSESDRKERLAHDDGWAEAFLHRDWRTLEKDWNSQAVLAGSPPLARTESAYDRTRLAGALRHFSLGRGADHRANLAGKDPLSFSWVVGAKDPKFLELSQTLRSNAGTFPLLVAAGAGHRLPWEAEPACAAAAVQLLSPR